MKKRKTVISKIRLKIGDKVKIISGREKGKISTVQSVLKKTSQIIVNGVNVKVKHVKTKQSNEGEKIKRIEFPIHSSNVLKYKE